MERGYKGEQGFFKKVKESFAKKGYGVSSIEYISKSTGVSKQSLNEDYGGKERIFCDMISAQFDEVIEDIQLVKGDDIKDLVADMCSIIVNFTHSETFLRIYRIILSEAVRFPNIGKGFYDLGYNRLKNAVSSHIAKKSDKVDSSCISAVMISVIFDSAINNIVLNNFGQESEESNSDVASNIASTLNL